MSLPRASWIVYGGSIALHMALAIGAVMAPTKKRHQAVAITMADHKKEKPEKRDTPPPPPPKAQAARAKSTPAPKPAAAKAEPPPSAAPQAAPAPGFADLGLTLGNGSGAGGMAVAARGPAGPAPTPENTTTRKVSALAPKSNDECDVLPVKPKPRAIVKPAYTEEARAAQIEGVVRVEITIGPGGQVVDVRILRGLGHGLDEAALAAARQMTFEPGTRCGKPALATISVGMRFALGS